MKRKAFWLLFTTVSLVAIFTGYGYDSSSAATINKITAQPGKLNTRIVLETAEGRLVIAEAGRRALVVLVLPPAINLEYLSGLIRPALERIARETG